MNHWLQARAFRNRNYQVYFALGTAFPRQAVTVMAGTSWAYLKLESISFNFVNYANTVAASLVAASPYSDTGHEGDLYVYDGQGVLRERWHLGRVFILNHSRGWRTAGFMTPGQEFATLTIDAEFLDSVHSSYFKM